MLPTRKPKPTIRLFPVDKTHTFVSTAQKEKNKYDYLLHVTTSAPPHLTTSGNVAPRRTDFPPFILPNGYYFDQVQYLEAGDTAVRERYAIKNALAADQVSNYIDEDLDTSLIATVFEEPGRHQIVGVDKARNEAFLYTLVPSRDRIHDETGSHRIKAYEFEGKFLRDQKRSVSIFNTGGRASIQSIVGLPSATSETCLVIAFNTGEIIMKIMPEDNKEECSIVCLQPPSANFSAKIRLLSSSNYLLIVHDDNKNTLTVWDFKKAQPFIGEYPCPDDMGNLNLSIDGKYLTARALTKDAKKKKDIAQAMFQSNLFLARLPAELRLEVLAYFNYSLTDDDESDLVHCFELDPFKYHLIKLPKPVSDFIIGKDGQVCTAYDTDCSLGVHGGHQIRDTIDKFLIPVPANAENKTESKEEKKEAQKKSKHILSTLASIFKHKKKDDPSNDPKKDGLSKGPAKV